MGTYVYYYVGDEYGMRMRFLADLAPFTEWFSSLIADTGRTGPRCLADHAGNTSTRASLLNRKLHELVMHLFLLDAQFKPGGVGANFEDNARMHKGGLDERKTMHRNFT